MECAPKAYFGATDWPQGAFQPGIHATMTLMTMVFGREKSFRLGESSFPIPEVFSLGLKSRTKYAYDAWNRLVAMKASDGTPIAAFQYDGLNRRIVKTNPDGWSEHYYYNQNGQILEDREVDNQATAQSIDQYVWNPGYVDSPMVCLHDGNADGDVMNDTYDRGSSSGDWRRYYLTDANHNVTTEIRFGKDWGGADYIGDVTRNVFTAYGTVTRQGANWSGDSLEGNFDGPLYCGYFFDHDTGLYQVDNRYYDPGLSTWINRDPIGYAGGSNLYAYCGDGPTNHSDPTGLFWGELWGAAKSAGIRTDQFLGQLNTVVWTGTWVAPDTTSGLGAAWDTTKGVGRGAVNTGVGLKNLGKEVALQAYDTGSGVVEIGGRLTGANWRFGAQSNLGEASLQPGFSYGTHVAETGANAVTVGVYGEVKAGYQLYKGQITVDQASQVFGSTAVLQGVSAGMVKAMSAQPNASIATVVGEGVRTDDGLHLESGFAVPIRRGEGHLVRARLPEFTGSPTSGMLRTPSGDFELVSGVGGPASAMPKGASGFDAWTRTHVEGDAAAHAETEDKRGYAFYQQPKNLHSLQPEPAIYVAAWKKP